MTQGFNQEYQKISALLGIYLQREQLETTQVADSHLDEDMLSAFIEGNLSRPESAPLLSHLVNCASCRSITAQLIRLEIAFDEDVPQHQATEPETGRLQKFFSDLVSRVFQTEEVVFANELKTEEPEQTSTNGSPPTEKEKTHMSAE